MGVVFRPPPRAGPAASHNEIPAVVSTTLSPVRRVDIVGVPMDLGASRRGVDMGPSAVRYARLHEKLRGLGIEIVDRGDLAVPIRESANSEDASAKFFTVISSVCHDLALLVEQAVSAGGMPIVLGGDHSIAMGTLTGLTRAYGSPPGLIWVDAHADINSPSSSTTGNVHGMPLYFALKNGFAVRERTVQIGLRDVDADEKRLLREFGVKTFTMTDVDKRGMMHVMDDARAIAGADAHPIHVSFDMDAIDPSEAPGTGTPVKGGLSYREAHLVMEMLADSGQLGSIEMVEINPIFDTRNQTASLAVGLICSALGKSIL
ncbi:MAG: arginase [Candidatus Eremiobacteraeota bacterium]|nr:arginase [Candidatus Eremiobacteraeota bacterium]MBV8498993.1 arginase [Candidatus Eremiobacteraeota bacterium]